MRLAIVLLFGLVCSLPAWARNASLDSLLTVLDETIERHQHYADRREQQIDLLQGRLRATGIPTDERYRLNHRLYQLYDPYVCDSTIAALNRCIDLAESLRRPDLAARDRIRLGYVLASAGMYMEAIDRLRQVDWTRLDSLARVDYYVACDHVYGELGFYTQDRSLGRYYRRRSEAYKDSIRALAAPSSVVYLELEETRLRDGGMLDEAFRLNQHLLAAVAPDTREQAILYYNRALIYREAGDAVAYRTALARSSIADIRAAVKDHASLWMLAQALFDDGDLERAYRYVVFSWSETSFFNARLRAWQSVDDLELISNTYQSMLHRRNAVLQRYIVFASVLLVLLVLALVYIWRQVKRLARTRRELLQANERLNGLNAELKQMNAELQQANTQLREANTIKENYLARFIKLCSTYVDRLEAYRRMVGKKIAAGQTAELLKISRSPSVLDDALDELYSNFDSVFLRIFPDFVAQFNALLREGEQILPKADGQLSTELRIFALIRLGITDSSQIAEFLHYSVNTIYNYRARVKNKACCREDFEQAVVRIA